jgi:DNA-binding Lrp family transcriptional regulator
MFRVDERDLHIVAAKERDPQATLAEVAQMVGIPAPTIAYKLRRLEDRGILSYRTVVDREKLSAAQAA